MRLLCVCQGGNVRSVCLARLLKKRGHESIGVGLNQKSLLPLLAHWAERIYPMDDEISKALWMLGYQHKMSSDYIIGPDDWHSPDHPDLLRRLRDLVEATPTT
jgi:hypothetical protein